MYKKRQLSYGYPMVILWVSYGMIPISAILKVNEGRERKVAEECGRKRQERDEGHGMERKKRDFL